MPLLSVITPTYNRAQTLGACHASLTAQTCRDFEWIVVDDGSTDGTAALIDGFRAAAPWMELDYIRKENGGVSSARNAGLERASGEWLAFLDSDDTLDPAFTASAAQLTAAHPGIDLFLSGAARSGSWRSGDPEHIPALDRALYENAMNSPCGKLFRRSLTQRAAIRFPEGLHIGEDKVFVFRYALAASGMAFSTPTLYRADTSAADSLSRKYRPALAAQVKLEYGLLFDALARSALAPPDKARLAKTLDYSFLRAAFTCAAEERKPGALDPSCRGLCAGFGRIGGRGYANALHLLMALTVRGRLTFAVRLLAALAAGRSKA